MKPNKIGKALITGAKTAALTVMMFITADATINATEKTIKDVEYGVNYIKEKTAPKVILKKPLQKPREVNLRTGLDSNKKPIKPKDLQKLREQNNYNVKAKKGV